MESERRRFLLAAPLGVAALLLAAGRAQGQAGAPRLDPNDPQVKPFGYVLDATKADKAKFASWKPAQRCGNCVHFKGKPADAWGPCYIFLNKQVSPKGWCSAWQARPAGQK